MYGNSFRIDGENISRKGEAKGIHINEEIIDKDGNSERFFYKLRL
jgi:hypothetical protein